jgi:hypothetical protein
MKTVYWSPHLSLNVYGINNINYQEPVNLITSMTAQRNKKANGAVFYSCPAYLEGFKNSFVIENPFDFDFTFPYQMETVLNAQAPLPALDKKTNQFLEGWANTRPPARTDSLSIDISIAWIFFCEDDLVMKTTPPYLHQTEYGKTALYIPGEFNIGSWFRPVDMALQMWPGERDFKSPVGDPLLYVHFETEEKVQLKRFYMTQEIYDISGACVKYKNFSPKSSLPKVYNLFKGAKLDKALIKLIKESVID